MITKPLSTSLPRIDYICEMTPEEFPYITEIKVNDCYAYKDFVIPIGKGDDGKPFRHLILTGKNGSGKTTILKSIAIAYFFASNRSYVEKFNPFFNIVTDKILNERELSFNFSSVNEVEIALKKILINDWKKSKSESTLSTRESNHIFVHYLSFRKLLLKNVSTIEREDDVQKHLKQSQINDIINQYLVNKKVFQAFDLIDRRKSEADKADKFFSQFEKILKQLFDDSNLELLFYREKFVFSLKLGDGREVSFNQLADGYSALISIIIDLLVRVDIMRRIVGDYNFEPCGFVLIDEPEAHLHIELQYQVLPLLTTLFPNIQFIVATHSPAVISSIPNAVVYDLTKQEIAKDWVVGSSYSELMVKHFGLDNEYSNIADKIIADIQQLVDDKNMKGKEKLAALKQLLDENGKYLAPSTMLEVETNILRIQEAA